MEQTRSAKANTLEQLRKEDAACSSADWAAARLGNAVVVLICVCDHVLSKKPFMDQERTHNTVTHDQEVTCRVPQGAVLGPFYLSSTLTVDAWFQI